MSKKNKSVLSIMLALMILLAPLSALHAKAENEKPYNDITRTYILTGESWSSRRKGMSFMSRRILTGRWLMKKSTTARWIS